MARIVILAGPNGAGKSTAAPLLLRDTLSVDEFVNADTIASGLSAFRPDRMGIAAGRLMLSRVKALARGGRDFAFETTMASRTFASWLPRLQREGWSVTVLFLWLPTAGLAVSRVAERVRLGGHDVPEETIRRRYARGLGNFFAIYRPMSDKWQVYDNSRATPPRLLAEGKGAKTDRVVDEAVWHSIEEAHHGAP